MAEERLPYGHQPTTDQRVPLLVPGPSPSGVQYSGGPGPSDPPAWSGRLFNEKVALDSRMQFDGSKNSKGANWRSVTRSYIVSKAPEAEIILRLVEQHEDVFATSTKIASSSEVAAVSYTHLTLPTILRV